MDAGFHALAITILRSPFSNTSKQHHSVPAETIGSTNAVVTNAVLPSANVCVIVITLVNMPKFVGVGIDGIVEALAVEVILTAAIVEALLLLIVLLSEPGSGVGAVMAKVLAVEDDDVRASNGIGPGESGPSVVAVDEEVGRGSKGVGPGVRGPRVSMVEVVLAEVGGVERVLEIETALEAVLELVLAP